jgi:type IV secretory pathway VirD2 relaxase
MIEAQLKEKSAILNISVEELIDRYIRRELFTDDYYEPRKLTREELLEMSKRDVKRDMENGIPPAKHNFDVFVNRWSDSD